MNKRLFAFILGSFLSIQLTFAASNNFVLNSLSNFLGENGLFGLLKIPAVAVSAIYIAMLIGFFNLIKVVMKTLPIFKHGEKEAGIISFVIAFMGTTGIFFMYKDSPEQMIIQFGGTIGFILMSVVFGSILMGLNNTLNHMGFKSFKTSAWWMWMGLAVFITGSVLMQLFIRVLAFGTTIGDYVVPFLENLMSIGFIAFLVGLILFIGKKSKQNKQAKKEYEKAHPEINEAKMISNKLITHVNKLEDLARRLVR